MAVANVDVPGTMNLWPATRKVTTFCPRFSLSFFTKPETWLRFFRLSAIVPPFVMVQAVSILYLLKLIVNAVCSNELLYLKHPFNVF